MASQTSVSSHKPEVVLPAKPLRQRHELAVSTEHYLRAILELKEERGYARVVDIATRVGVTKGSVSAALALLVEKGLVRFDQAHFPVLTTAGKRVAQDVRGRYSTVLSFLVDVLGLPAEQAAAEACRWEHVISHDVAGRLGTLHDAVMERGGHRTIAALLKSMRAAAHADEKATGGPAGIIHLKPPGDNSDEEQS